MGLSRLGRSPRVPHWKLRRWLPAVLLTGFGGGVVAQPPAPMPTPPAAAPAPAPEPRYTYEFDKASWDSVFNWYSRTAKLAPVATAKPTNTVSLKFDQMTLSEVTDRINEALAAEKFILLRLSQSFNILPADVKLPPDLIPRVTVAELPRYGQSEVVFITIPLRTVTPESIVPSLQKLKSNFGEVSAFGNNFVVVQDKAAIVRNMMKAIEEIDNPKGLGDNVTHQCKYQRASTVADKLKTLLSDADTQVSSPTPIGAPGTPGFNPGFNPGFAPPAFNPRGGVAATARFKTVNIAVLEESNTLYITGPADKLAAADRFLKDMDTPPPGADPKAALRVVGPATLQQYAVPAGQAENIVKVLSEQYKSSLVTKILPAGNAILVFAYPADHMDIVAQIKGMGEQKSPSATEFIPLSTLDPKTTADSVTKALGNISGGSTNSGVAVDPKTDTNPPGLLVTGTPAQIEQAKQVLRALGESPPGAGVPGLSGSTGFQIINVDKGNAAVLAEVLQKMLRDMGKKAEVNNPAAAPPAPKPAEPAKQKSAAPNRLGDLQHVNYQQPAAKPAELAVPGEKPAVTITVTPGNKLIVSSDDPATAQMVAQLARLLTDERRADDLYEVIRLKNVDAATAAEVITEVFNGPKQSVAPQGGGRGGGGFNPIALLGQFAGIGASAPAAPTAGRVRVVAEKSSNSLIVVKATPLDLATIKKLLEKAIDSDDPAIGGVIKPWYIKLQYAKAASVAEKVTELFRNLTTVSRGGGGGFPFPFPGAQPQQGNQTAALTAVADDASNQVIVNCTETVYGQVKALCEELDRSTKDTTSVVRIIATPGLNPTEVQAAIEALTGRPGASSQGTTGGFNRPGGGFGGGNFGGSPFGGMGGGMGRPGGMGGGFGAPGGMGGGRGGTRGGGGRNQRSSLDDGGGGQRPFDYAGTDAPQNLIHDPAADDQASAAGGLHDPMLVQAQAKQPAGGSQSVPAPSPSDDITITANDALGAIIIKARTEADIAEVEKFIKLLQQQAADAEIKIEVVPLQRGDATQLNYLLTQIFQRIQTNAGTSTIINGPSQQQGFFGNFGFGAQQNRQQPGQAAGSLVFIALPRLNSILVAAPKSQIQRFVDQIRALDKDNDPSLRPVPYQLKKASAQVVKQVLDSFLGQRYPGESLTNTQTRTIADIPSNTVLVQASAADQKEIADLVRYLDTTMSQAINEVKVFRLRNAFADELASVLNTALTSSILNPSLGANATTLGVQTGATPVGGQAFGAPGGGFGQQGGFGGGQNALGSLTQRPGQLGGIGGGNAFGGAGGTAGTANSAATGLTTKTTTLKFRMKDGTWLESGMLEDVHIVADGRINALVVAAPERTMMLLEGLIQSLDTTSAAQAFVNVYPLKRANVVDVQNLLTALFRSDSTTGAGGAGAGANAFGGPATAAQGGGGQFGATGGVTRPLLTLTGNPADGANLLSLRITGDPRTNTLIVAGSRADLDTIAAVIGRLEDAPALQVRSEVMKLRNAAAADVANAVNAFIQAKVNFTNLQFSTANGPSSQAILKQSFVVTPEPVSNTLSIAAPPELFDEIANLVLKIDMTPPQVKVDVLIAEVQLDNTEQFGVEIGLQTPIVFARSSAANNPGFNFNSAAAAAAGPANTNLYKQESVGFQGLGNLGVGRTGANGLSGLVFSAASDTVSVLVRALKTQGRTDILSRPQLTVVDNQVGFFQVGQRFPRLDTSTLSGAGTSQQGITYEELGIVMRVTPRISPDNRVLMRIEPQISAPGAQINLGTAGVATAFDTQSIQTTVQVADGETFILGGLIRRSDIKSENKIPVLGDLPWVGAAFRYRTQQQQRRELIFIVTPHVIRTSEDVARLALAESAKMSWNFADVMGIHGYGADVLNGRRQQYCPPSPSAALTTPTVFGDASLSGPAPQPGAVMVTPGAAPPVATVPVFQGSPTSTGPAPLMMPSLPPGVSFPQPQPLPGGVAPGFPPQANGQPTVFAPPVTQSGAVTVVPPPQPAATEGQSWSVYGK